MFNLVYASKAVTPLSGGELLEWLHHFRPKNARLGITGLLIYKDASFMQALEGEEDAVRDIFDVIRQDNRHHRVNVLLTITISERQFPDWSMGFKNLDGIDASSLPGYKQPKELPPWVDILPWRASVAMRLLAEFNKEE